MPTIWSGDGRAHADGETRRTRVTKGWARAVVVGALVLLALVASVTVFEERTLPIAVGMALGVFLLGIGAVYFGRLPRVYLSALAVALVAYAVLGRGFASIGIAPLFVGELLLVFGLGVLLLHSRRSDLARTPVVWPLASFMVVGVVATVPHVAVYGLNAARDAVLWGYAVFAFTVAGLIVDERSLRTVVGWYTRALPVLLAGPLIAVVVARLLGDQMPTVPFGDVPIVATKAGDVAVHLAGMLAFVVLGLHRHSGSAGGARLLIPQSAWWALWLVAWVATLTSRAAFVTVALVGSVLFLVRPAAPWWRLIVVLAVLLLAAMAFDVEVTLRRDSRPLSVSTIMTSLESVIAPVDAAGLDGPRGWRLRWWSDIIDYTVFGRYFWTGKGYGINLADADGYQVWSDGSLRSPHNGHLTVLARSGVPGAVAWLVLNLGLVVALGVAYQRRRMEGRTWWAHLNLWLAAYWLAFIVNASFDVYLEGPMGGIWFWSMFGLAMAALRIQRTRADQLDANGP